MKRTISGRTAAAGAGFLENLVPEEGIEPSRGVTPTGF